MAITAVALMNDEALSAFEVMAALDERLHNGKLLDAVALFAFPPKADGTPHTKDEMRLALVARFQDANGRKSLEELHGLASLFYPPRVMSRVSIIRLTANAPSLKRLLGTVAAASGSDIVDDLAANIGTASTASRMMQALILEKAFVKLSSCDSAIPGRPRTGRSWRANTNR